MITDRSVVVRDTQYVVPPRHWHEEPFHEVLVGRDHGKKTPYKTLITRDAKLVTCALALEGMDTRIDVTYHIEARRTRRRLLLDAICEDQQQRRAS